MDGRASTKNGLKQLRTQRSDRDAGESVDYAAPAIGGDHKDAAPNTLTPSTATGQGRGRNSGTPRGRKDTGGAAGRPHPDAPDTSRAAGRPHPDTDPPRKAPHRRVGRCGKDGGRRAGDRKARRRPAEGEP
ncbi:hypothetical protein GCM10010109_49860 [Actinoplanes campanulatus]|nr:hypothetical protein GCM10010109_49860 [Actinoplanes campanulatus]GID37173.1 hypothetical protein Aca09nite_36790 [Actinoplanes campanulatus]